MFGKFKAWDKGERCWIPRQDICITGESKILTREGDRWVAEVLDIEVVFFTGLLDKNGKEIYEGDILTDCYKRILEVVWRNNGFQFKSLCQTNFLYAEMNHWFSFDFADKPEVIGNIYENPELLK